jgi:hypothetical protein
MQKQTHATGLRMNPIQSSSGQLLREEASTLLPLEPQKKLRHPQIGA